MIVSRIHYSLGSNGLNLVLLFLLLAIPVLLFGQKDEFLKGHILFITGEKVEGFIKEYSDSEISNEIEFKSSRDARIKTFRPNEIVEFFIEPSNYFESVYVNNDKVEKRFLRKILDGSTQLFRFDNNSNIEYVLKKENGELLHISKKDNVTSSSIEYDVKYIGELKNFLRECSETFKIKNIVWHEKKLIDLVTNYNQCVKPNSSSLQLVKKKKPQFGYGLTLGLRFLEMIPAKKVTSNPRSGIISLSISEIVFSPQVGLAGYFNFHNKSFLNFGLNYSYYQVESKDRDALIINQTLSTLEIPISYKYNFTSRMRTVYYLVGTTRDLVLKETTKYEVAVLGGGFSNPTSIPSNYDQDNKNPIDFHFGLGYEFMFQNIFVNFEILYMKANLKINSRMYTLTNGVGINTKVLF